MPLKVVLAPVPPNIFNVSPSANWLDPESETTFNCCNPPKALTVIPLVEDVNVILAPLTSFLNCKSAPAF